MSTLESFIWHLLGYAAIPLIVLGGIFVASVLFYMLVSAFDSGSKD